MFQLHKTHMAVETEKDDCWSRLLLIVTYNSFTKPCIIRNSILRHKLYAITCCCSYFKSLLLKLSFFAVQNPYRNHAACIKNHCPSLKILSLNLQHSLITLLFGVQEWPGNQQEIGVLTGWGHLHHCPMTILPTQPKSSGITPEPEALASTLWSFWVSARASPQCDSVTSGSHWSWYNCAVKMPPSLLPTCFHMSTIWASVDIGNNYKEFAQH